MGINKIFTIYKVEFIRHCEFITKPEPIYFRRILEYKFI